MTKQEVLNDIDQLCTEIDECETSFVNASIKKDWGAYMDTSIDAVRLLVGAHQELSFLRDYVEEKIKEE